LKSLHSGGELLQCRELVRVLGRTLGFSGRGLRACRWRARARCCCFCCCGGGGCCCCCCCFCSELSLGQRRWRADLEFEQRGDEAVGAAEREGERDVTGDALARDNGHLSCPISAARQVATGEPARGKGGGVESATLAGGSLERPRQWRGAQWPRPLPLGVLRRPEPSGAP
jgi:hypothetical protein